MLGGVDAKAVDAIFGDPAAIDVDHSAHDARILGEDIVEADEVAHGARLATESAVAAVVVIDRIVEPGRAFDAPLGRRHAHRVGVVRVLEPGEVGATAVALAGEAGIDRRAIDAAAPLVRVIGNASVRAFVFAGAFLEIDDIRRVVDDDVHVELHAAGVDRVNQRLEVGVRSEMRIDSGKVGDPIAVVAGALLSRRALHRLVLEDRSDPDGGRA